MYNALAPVRKLVEKVCLSENFSHVLFITELETHYGGFVCRCIEEIKRHDPTCTICLLEPYTKDIYPGSLGMFLAVLAAISLDSTADFHLRLQCSLDRKDSRAPARLIYRALFTLGCPSAARLASACAALACIANGIPLSSQEQHSNHHSSRLPSRSNLHKGQIGKRGQLQHRNLHAQQARRHLSTTSDGVVELELIVDDVSWCRIFESDHVEVVKITLNGAHIVLQPSRRHEPCLGPALFPRSHAQQRMSSSSSSSTLERMSLQSFSNLKTTLSVSKEKEHLPNERNMVYPFEYVIK